MNRMNMIDVRILGMIPQEMKLKTLAATALMLVSLVVASAQEPESPAERQPLSFGMTGGFGLNLFAGTLDVGTDPRLGGGACGLVSGGKGYGYAIGAFSEYTLSPLLSIGLRGIVEDRSGTMQSAAPESYHRLSSGVIAPVESDYLFSIDALVASVEAYGIVQPFSFPLRLSFGPKVGFATAPSYSFAEELKGENEFAFSNGTKRLEFSSGSTPSAIQLGLAGGASWVLSMGGGFDLIPEVNLSANITPLLSGYDAPRLLGIRPSVSVRYTLGVTPPPPPPPPLPPTVEPVTPPAPPPPPVAPIVATLRVVGVGPSGESIDHVEIVSDERVSRREIALLPYIFFDEGSSEVPSRYKGRATASGDRSLDYYRQILPLLAERMKSRTDETIRLTGTNADAGIEKGNLELSRARAEQVKSELVNRYGIAANRIEVAAQNLPTRFSNPAYTGGDAENRRVEITSSKDLLAPIVLNDTLRTLSSNGVRISSSAESGGAIREQVITLSTGERVFRTISGEPEIRPQFDEPLVGPELVRLAAGEPLVATMNVRDDAGQSESTGRQIVPVEVKRNQTNDILLDQHSILLSTPILFPYNSAELSRNDRERLQELRRTLPDSAALTITGYADDLGETGYNRSLSQRRAEAVASLFNGIPVTIVAGGEETHGEGETPEERFYSRTVTIQITR